MIFFPVPFDEIPVSCLPGPGEVFGFVGPSVGEPGDEGWQRPTIGVAFFHRIVAPSGRVIVGQVVVGYTFYKEEAELLASHYEIKEPS